MKKLSYKVALGGVIASIAIFIMFLTGFGPFLTYLCPMCAGALLVMIVIEVSRKWAFATYVAIALLCVFITPDKESAMLFIFLFGYYPILKSIIEKVKSRVTEWIIKMAVFNISVVSAYWLLMNVFGMGQLLDSLGDWGKYGVLIFLGLANLAFVMYDYALSSVVDSYIKWFRPKFLRKIR